MEDCNGGMHAYFILVIAAIHGFGQAYVVIPKSIIGSDLLSAGLFALVAMKLASAASISAFLSTERVQRFRDFRHSQGATGS